MGMNTQPAPVHFAVEREQMDMAGKFLEDDLPDIWTARVGKKQRAAAVAVDTPTQAKASCAPFRTSSAAVEGEQACGILHRHPPMQQLYSPEIIVHHSRAKIRTTQPINGGISDCMPRSKAVTFFRQRVQAPPGPFFALPLPA